MQGVVRSRKVQILLGSVFLCAVSVSAQQGISLEQTTAPGLLNRQQMLPELQLASGKLGDRLTAPGKEQVVLIGRLTDANGPRPLRVTWQVGGWFRLEELGGKERVLLFDGTNLKNSKGSIGPDEQRLIDSLAIALPENVFWQAANQAVATRFLGGHFRATDSMASDYSGPYTDLFAIYPPSDSAVGLFVAQRQHVIGLDSGTLLLASVGHAESDSGTSSDVQTQLSNWIEQARQWFPGVITRLESSRQTLQFVVTNFQVNAAADRTAFQN